MSYAQVIPNMWITCGLAVDELGMECGSGEKTKNFHISTNRSKEGQKRRVSSYYIVREFRTGSPESKGLKRRFKPVNKGKKPLDFLVFCEYNGK